VAADADRERFLMVLHDLAGQPVTVDLADSTFSAVFHTVSSTLGGDCTYVFKAARGDATAGGGDGSVAARGYTTRLVKASDIVMMSVASMSLKESAPGSRAGGFQTDSETSGSSAAHLANRALADVSLGGLGVGGLQAYFSTSCTDLFCRRSNVSTALRPIVAGE